MSHDLTDRDFARLPADVTRAHPGTCLGCGASTPAGVDLCPDCQDEDDASLADPGEGVDLPSGVGA